MGLAVLAWLTVACEARQGPERGAIPPVSTPVQSSAASSAAAVADVVASGGVSAPTTAARVRTPPARAPGELPGRTVDYPYDAKDVGDSSRAYEGRAFVHDLADGAGAPLPLVVFLHGLNRELIPHRWMGGGNEGDVRRIVADLIDRRLVPPVVVAGPGSIERAAVGGSSSFPVFDLTRFVELTEAALSSQVRIDRDKIVVLGHSGAGCSAAGGLIAAARAPVRPLAVISIDTCMTIPLAEALAGAPPGTHVVVTWQTASWKRDFARFQSVFTRVSRERPAAEGILRELDPLPSLPRAHDATVGQTFEKWLPKILPPSPP